MTAAAAALGPQLGIPHHTLRRWAEQARVDDGAKAGTTTADSQEVAALKKEVQRLREANEILRQASIFFARELDPHRR